MYTGLTETQKLRALGAKYYQGLVWQPKAGDYYTTCRFDLELYKIVREDDEHLYTKYLDRECSEAKWPKAKFLEDFGVKRVWVPEWILELKN
jgi:hypothetical protein